jgi:hypothetical protein
MKKIILLFLMFVFAFTAVCEAGTIFVATAKNIRGALYLGYGPNPQSASEQAMSKCTQNSFFTGSCHVVHVRCEYVPDRPIAKVQTSPHKVQTFRPVSFQ